MSWHAAYRAQFTRANALQERMVELERAIEDHRETKYGTSAGGGTMFAADKELYKVLGEKEKP